MVLWGEHIILCIQLVRPEDMQSDQIHSHICFTPVIQTARATVPKISLDSRNNELEKIRTEAQERAITFFTLSSLSIVCVFVLYTFIHIIWEFYLAMKYEVIRNSSVNGGFPLGTPPLDLSSLPWEHIGIWKAYELGEIETDIQTEQQKLI